LYFTNKNKIMKKITFILIALSMSIASCQKEKLQPTDVQQETNTPATQEQVFKYSQTVSIFDESGKYSLEQLIRCNDENTFYEEIEHLKSIQLKLTYSAPRKNETANLTPINSADPSTENFPWTKEKNVLYITFKNIKIGNAKGFYFESKHKAKSTAEEWSGYVFVGPSYQVYDWSESVYQADLQFMSGTWPVDVNFFSYHNGYLQTQLSSSNSFTSLPVTWGYTSHFSLRLLGPSQTNMRSVIKIHWVAVPL
jgi:hypothetical protein